MVITGASAGIGRATTRILAEKGAEIVMAVRNVTKGEGVAEAMRVEQPDAKLHVMELDLSNLTSVRSFATKFLATFDSLDMLINNAGVYDGGEKMTNDGFALVMGVNHLGHFALTGLLLECLLSTPQSRIVTVTSGAHRRGKINLDTFHTIEAAKDGAYGNSKLANILFALELQRKLQRISTKTISLAAGPGATKSDAVQELIQSRSNRFVRGALDALTNIVMEPPAMGAMPLLRAATDPQAIGGAYFGPAGFMGMRGYSAMKEPAKSADNLALAQGLWVRSAELTDITYELLLQSQRNS